ncbi:acyl-CoA dehydrogenase [Virgibacillus indicus]|uniref:Acyl-CoA dehydrogenase n=1 Tax=Virgibacillus indicus TaxID=2024554 RepID=A0A265N7Y3_9BACI|nr:acyl-CoA dehydrogenase family protein [Virgibacillus indicus]OZU87574.1 acyl-CoA dehydrogenase [Virgibacillus indicus]
MDTLLFDEDQLQVQYMLQKFAQKEIAPLAGKRDEEEYFDWGAFQKMAGNGLTGIPWPEEYGGTGMDYVAFINAIEELSKVCGATGSDLAIHTALASFPIYKFGTEEQKQTYLRELATGRKLGSFSLTEPGHGSNYQRLATRAVKDGEEYVLNGDKVFTSNAGPAGIYIVFALSDPDSEKEGLSAFIVEKGTKGFTIGKPERKMGIRGHAVASLHFEDCRIPAENLLGSEGQGYKIARQTLYGGRLAMSAQALGIAEGAYQLGLEYVKSREQFGKHLSDFQTIRFKLADMAMQIEASRLLVYQAAMLQTKGMDFSTESAMCKAFVSEMAMKLTTDAVQLFGGYGYTRDYPVERMMRDAKITQIYTGTVEMQRIEIADKILG